MKQWFACGKGGRPLAREPKNRPTTGVGFGALLSNAGQLLLSHYSAASQPLAITNTNIRLLWLLQQYAVNCAPFCVQHIQHKGYHLYSIPKSTSCECYQVRIEQLLWACRSGAQRAADFGGGPANAWLWRYNARWGAKKKSFGPGGE